MDKRRPRVSRALYAALGGRVVVGLAVSALLGLLTACQGDVEDPAHSTSPNDIEASHSGGLVASGSTALHGRRPPPAACSCSGDTVCERSPGGGAATCADPSWAEWPIPPDVHPTNYKDNGDGTVTDTVTGLIWQQASGPATTDWSTAKSYCTTTVNLGGHTDWRLPSKIELASIVDYGTGNPAINTKFFPDTQPNFYWSATPMADSSFVWGINFLEGATAYDLESWATPFPVRCVR